MPVITPEAVGVATVTAANSTIVIGGTPAAPTVSTDWTQIVKPANTARNVAVQAIDPHLQFVAAAGVVYEWEMNVVYASPAGAGLPDFIGSFGEDNIFRGAYDLLYVNVTPSLAFVWKSCALNDAYNAETYAIKRGQMFHGWYEGNGNPAGLYWSQLNLNVNDVIVYAGSVLRYRQMV